MLGRRRAVRLLRLEEDPRGDRLALREVLRGRRERVAIRRLRVEPFVVEELEGLLGVLAFLLSLGLLFFPPLCLRLGLLRQEARVRRAVLLIVLFADVLLLRLGVTGTSRAVLIIVALEMFKVAPGPRPVAFVSLEFYRMRTTQR